MLMGQGIPTLVASDFNYIGSIEEKRGGRAFVDGVESKKFWEFMEDNRLVDLGFDGPILLCVITIKVGIECWRELTRFLLELTRSRST